MPWVSQYLVMKRVSIEPNFHGLYSNFLDTLKNPEFVKMVLNETYRNIKVNSEGQGVDFRAFKLSEADIFCSFSYFLPTTKILTTETLMELHVLT